MRAGAAAAARSGRNKPVGAATAHTDLAAKAGMGCEVRGQAQQRAGAWAYRCALAFGRLDSSMTLVSVL
jgi:hypothetical protein